MCQVCPQPGLLHGHCCALEHSPVLFTYENCKEILRLCSGWIKNETFMHVCTLMETWLWREEQKALHGLSLIEVTLMSGMRLPWSIIFRQCNLFVFAVSSFVHLWYNLIFLVQAFHTFYFQIKVPDKRIQDWIEKTEWTLYRCPLALFTPHVNLLFKSDLQDWLSMFCTDLLVQTIQSVDFLIP